MCNKRWASIAAVLLLLAVAAPAQAYERQWHLGGQLGYALAGFEGGPCSGLGGGLHLSYGVNDFMNLRVHGDVSGYDLADPASMALIWNGGAGVEFAFDVLQVVPYVGATVGAAAVSIRDGDTSPALSLELPAGAMYNLSRDIALGVELRYRLLVPNQIQTPLHNMAAFARVEYIWGY